MKLKLDEEQHVVLQDGKPVYVYDDGKEISFDAPAAMGKIKELNNEAKNHRLKADEFKTSSETYQQELNKLKKNLEKYDGIDVRKAKQAMDTFAKFESGELLESEKVEALKQQISSTYDDEKNSLLEQFQTKEQEYQQKLDEYGQNMQFKDQKIYDLLVNNQFASLPFIQKHTTMTPDVAATMFGKHFKIEQDDDQLNLVAYLNGEKILSREKPGEVASFDEAFKIIWDAYPNRDAYTRATAGSGSTGAVENNSISGEDALKSFYGSMS